jgi:ferredoxin-NADP reductase/predicted pyridoxine 5'-phosphate oxidase superfamily flavin-nucleotide-binding protein
MTDTFTLLTERTALSPFHAGELEVQERVGVREFAHSSGTRSIRRVMPEQHRTFFNDRPFMVLGGVDANGQPWATLRVGQPRFVSSPDVHTLRIAGTTLPGDPLADAWSVGSMIGALGIQPETRRRNRVNGVITSLDHDEITLDVSQSFGNCPKYIQGRTPTFVPHALCVPRQPQRRATQLDDADRALLEAADTFFIASANGSDDAGFARGADVSHRGGRPGFVRVDDANTLTVPDFSGNRFFNTLGNLAVNSRAGLLFLDFVRGDLLYIAVESEIIWDEAQISEFAGAERLVRFHVREVRRSPAVLPFTWSPVEYAPQFAAFEAAHQAAQQATHAAAHEAPDPVEHEGKSASRWKSLDVVAIVQETPAIRSFYFKATDGASLASFVPGQYLPIQIPVPGHDTPLIRTYTLSDAHNAALYRITVKRDGVASAWLHDHVVVGTKINAKTPRGDFVFDASSPRPAVLLSAGIGITPMMAIVTAALADGSDSKPLHFIHGARNARERPFAAELEKAKSRHKNLHVHLIDSAPEAEVSAVTIPGRVTIDQIKRLLPFDDYDFYLCGPSAFMQDIYTGLRALNVPDERIRFEAFGTASVKRTSSVAAPVEPGADARSTPVTFARSERTIQWMPKDGTLLEFAEANGIPAEFSCRIGECGTCATRVREGEIAYSGNVEADIAPGCALLCIGRPVGDMPIVLEL